VRGRLVLALPLLLALTACSEAIVSRMTYRSHAAYTDEAHERFEQSQQDGPIRKPEVLATLGPPILVIPQPEGDLFVYRREALDTTIIHLNPAFISYFGTMPPIPLYFGSFTRGRVDVLMVFFDTLGNLVDAGSRFDIAGDSNGPAAGDVAPREPR